MTVQTVSVSRVGASVHPDSSLPRSSLPVYLVRTKQLHFRIVSMVKNSLERFALDTFEEGSKYKCWDVQAKVTPVNVITPDVC